MTEEHFLKFIFSTIINLYSYQDTCKNRLTNQSWNINLNCISTFLHCLNRNKRLHIYILTITYLFIGKQGSLKKKLYSNLLCNMEFFR